MYQTNPLSYRLEQLQIKILDFISFYRVERVRSFITSFYYVKTSNDKIF